MAATSAGGGGPAGGPGPPAGSGTSQLEAPRTRGVTTVAYASEDGAIMVSPSFLHAASVEECTVMLTRYDPSHLLRKDVVAAGVREALNATGAIHTIQAIWKYTRDQKIICVKFANSESAATMIGLKTVDIDGVTCAVSKYGERLVRIELARVPMHATIEELLSVVGHLGIVKSITRPLVHGFEDHLVNMTILPLVGTNFVDEQKQVLRPATFSGQSYVIQYRCLDETVVCTACKERGHFNGPKCPMANRCLICKEEGHQRRNCPTRAPQHRREVPADGGADAFPDNETMLLQRPVNRQAHPRKPEEHGGKPEAPPPPPMSPTTLTSTALPPLVPGNSSATWGNFSVIDNDTTSQRSRSPLSSRHTSSNASSAEEPLQQKLEKIAEGAKNRAKELGLNKKKHKPFSCIKSNTLDESFSVNKNGNNNMNIAQLDGAEDSDDSDGSGERVGTGTDDTEKCFFKDYEEWEIQDIIDNKHSFLCCECGEKGCTNVCLKCPIFPTTWCSEEHICITAQSQLAAFGMNVTDIPPCSDCGLIGMHTCDNDNYKRIPLIEFC